MIRRILSALVPRPPVVYHKRGRIGGARAYARVNGPWMSALECRIEARAMGKRAVLI